MLVNPGGFRGGNLQNVKIGHSVCQIFPMITIEIVINSSHSGVTLYPVGMHCPRWRDDAFGF